MMGLSDGRKSFQIRLVVLIQYRLWQTASHPASHVAVAITLNAKASSLKTGPLDSKYVIIIYTRRLRFTWVRVSTVNFNIKPTCTSARFDIDRPNLAEWHVWETCVFLVLDVCHAHHHKGRRPSAPNFGELRPRGMTRNDQILSGDQSSWEEEFAQCRPRPRLWPKILWQRCWRAICLRWLTLSLQWFIGLYRQYVTSRVDWARSNVEFLASDDKHGLGAFMDTSLLFTLRAKLSGAVYCYRSCLCACLQRADGRCTPNLTTASARSVCVSLSAFIIGNIQLLFAA